MIRRPARLAPLALLLLLPACAWSNRANRPVWNAFEQRLVPEGDAAFYAALPLTVPGGLLAIVTDTLVVHPAQVADDAWDDAADLWDEVPWAAEYYTQLALLPFRAVGTPLVFAGSFLGRSCFDVPSREATQASRLEDERRSLDESRGLLQRVAAGERLDAGDLARLRSLDWHAGLQPAFDAALARGPAPSRLALLRWVHERGLPPAAADPALGLRDPDPVVRHAVLGALRRPAGVPAELRDALRADTSESVRLLARELWP